MQSDSAIEKSNSPYRSSEAEFDPIRPRREYVLPNEEEEAQEPTDHNNHTIDNDNVNPDADAVPNHSDLALDAAFGLQTAATDHALTMTTMLPLLLPKSLLPTTLFLYIPILLVLQSHTGLSIVPPTVYSSA